ncbi:hypothetical protein Nepgr_028421 [Nepenthes gracilis]|uniref:WRKY domain-containing protein n=1 Tax=Nepenthes gracilis TaxID=150966 RepID=A0AAD3Y2E2_NEPGR|nr:hypothetical protein Nepgr_028421 [Nepenthes gracilis]
MGEFADRTDDWDLQAIIKGRRSEESMLSMVGMEAEPSCGSSFGFGDYMQDTTTFLNELEQLYQPFLVSTSLCVELEEPPTEQPENRRRPLAVTANSKGRLSRKSKNKITVVHQATVDGSVHDKWRWRKYGQKPIKGSPYPRSYYRCSSSVGCQAKKHVEQSCVDPRTHIITYIAEHSHPLPTSRLSQAAAKRRKSPSSFQLEPTAPDHHELIVPDAEDEHSSKVGNEESGKVQEEEEEEEELAISNMAWDDDYFLGLEDSNGLAMELVYDPCSLNPFQTYFS